MDETDIGGKNKNRHANKKIKQGRRSVGKQATMGMRQKGGKVKAMPIGNTDQMTLLNKVGESIEFGATLYADDYKGYNSLGGLLYKHIVDVSDGTEIKKSGLKALAENSKNVLEMDIARKPPTEMTGFASRASVAVAKQILFEMESKELLSQFNQQ